MKKVAIALLVALAIPVMAQAEVEMIGGVAAGYGIGGAATKESFYNATAGTVLKSFNEGHTKLYTVGRYTGNGDSDSHWGGKVLLANRFKAIPWLWAVMDGGALDGVFTNADGTETMAATIGAGLAASVSPYMSIAVYGEVYRADGETWNRVIWLSTQSHLFF